MSDIYAYYQNYDESTRLTRDRLHYGEYYVTMHLLRKYLGDQLLKILDCCAGCGIFAEALAGTGHIVTAGDLIPEHVAYMKENCTGLSEIYEGSVCDLSRFDDESFDAVLNFGAMYHLQDPDERKLAVSECLRVLRHGGIFAYTYQSLEAMILGGYHEAVRCLDEQKRLDSYLGMEESRQTHCRGLFYGMTPEEVNALAAENNLLFVANANTYPVFYPFFREIDSYTEEEYARWLEVCVVVCEDKTVVNNCMHGLWFGRKP